MYRIFSVVVNKCIESLAIFNKKFELDLKMNVGLFEENMTQRRLRLCSSLDNIYDRIDMQQLERLQQLQQLERLQRLQITNKSYEQIEITTLPKETIIYLDPPYEDTAKYNKGICHKEFYAWVDTLIEKGFKVYISSYKCPLPCILELEHRSTLSATANNKVTEKLFCNIESIETKPTYREMSLF